VLFQWGSLVGVSPEWKIGGTYSIDPNHATAVYIPNYAPGGTSTWSAPAISPYEWNNTIPNMSSFQGVSVPNLSEALMNPNLNTTTMYQNKRGDICQYLSKTDSALTGYRMPKETEFATMPGENLVAWNTMAPSVDGWVKGAGDFYYMTQAYNSNRADGQTDMLNAAGNYDKKIFGSAINAEQGVVLPASGMLTGIGWMNAGMQGYYWSCSAPSPGAGCTYLFTSSMCATADGMVATGYPVRCIRTE
jgi:hypothetical protein